LPKAGLHGFFAVRVFGQEPTSRLYLATGHRKKGLETGHAVRRMFLTCLVSG